MRRMKLPQGVGQVYKLSGARRNPYIVRKTIGFTEVNGKKKQVIKTIGYARTYQEGFTLLMSYNNDLQVTESKPSIVVVPESKFKFEQIYEMWSKDFYATATINTVRGYTAAFKAFFGIHNKIFATLKTRDYEAIIEDSDKNYSTIKKMKYLLNMLYRLLSMNM